MQKQTLKLWEDAYFDVSFANVNAESYKDDDTVTIFATTFFHD